MSTGLPDWEIVCPDGNVRHFPYRNHDDATFDASVYTNRGCALYPVPNDLERAHPPCPGGDHAVRHAPSVAMTVDQFETWCETGNLPSH